MGERRRWRRRVSRAAHSKNRRRFGAQRSDLGPGCIVLLADDDGTAKDVIVAPWLRGVAK